MRPIRPALQIVAQAAFAAILLAGCQEKPEVRAVRSARTSVEATVSSVNSGTIEAEQVAELAFGLVGRVRKLNVKLGDHVKQGAVLAELENDDLIANLETAEVEQRRRDEMRRSKLIAQAQIDDARKMVDSARAAFEKSLIRAPYDGIIAEMNLEVGQLSQITTIIPKALIRIVDTSPRYVRAEVDEVDLPKVKPNQIARVKVLAARREPFRAVVRKVVPYVGSQREQDRTSEVELTIDSDGILLPAGASADVEIITDAKADVLAVPARAVLGRGGDRYVFRLDGARAVKTAVQVGLFNYDRSEITSGLGDGDIVLIPTDSAELADQLKVDARVESWP